MKNVNTVPTVSTREKPHLGVLFYRARRLLDEEILRELAAAGYDDVRSAHGAVFSYMPKTGTRLTALARRARITKQSMGELVRDLESLGYVERVRDPADGRAQIIRYTAKGRRADAIGVRAIGELERRWARDVGGSQMAGLRSTLEAIVRRPDLGSQGR
jgi:DNA-binding MarR family transcriptional regulator